MQIRVIAKTRAKNPGVKQLTESVYEVSVNAPPVGGRANTEIVESLAKYFCLHRNQILIVAGHSAVNKTVELLEE